MANESLRALARENGVKLWEIAAFWQISEPTMTRWLRQELNSVQRTRFEKAVAAISAAHEEQEADANG